MDPSGHVWTIATRVEDTTEEERQQRLARLQSRVTIEMTPSGGGTDLVLTHGGLPNDEMGRGHEEGWRKITGVLAEKIGGLY